MKTLTENQYHTILAKETLLYQAYSAILECEEPLSVKSEHYSKAQDGVITSFINIVKLAHSKRIGNLYILPKLAKYKE